MPGKNQELVKITGTKDYKTATGASQTIFVMEPETEKEHKDREEAIAKKSKEERKQ
jgi:hypothetical protein